MKDFDELWSDSRAVKLLRRWHPVNGSALSPTRHPNDTSALFCSGQRRLMRKLEHMRVTAFHSRPGEEEGEKSHWARDGKTQWSGRSLGFFPRSFVLNVF